MEESSDDDSHELSMPLIRSSGGRDSAVLYVDFPRFAHRWDAARKRRHPGAKTGETLLVDFMLAGQKYQALNGEAHDRFNDVISLGVTCQDQPKSTVCGTP